MGILLSFIAGLMIHIATFELLKESISYKRYKRTYLFFIIGVFFMLFSLKTFGGFGKSSYLCIVNKTKRLLGF